MRCAIHMRKEICVLCAGELRTRLSSERELMRVTEKDRPLIISFTLICSIRFAAESSCFHSSAVAVSL